MVVSRDRYFDAMRDTSVHVSAVMQRAIDTLSSVVRADTATELWALAHRRASPDCLKMKAFFLRLAYEASGGSGREDVISTCGAAAELLNVSQYAANHVLDGKGGYRTTGDASHLIIAALLFREQAEELLLEACELAHLSAAESLTLARWFSLIESEVYRGQLLDLDVLVFGKASSLDGASFRSLYLDRCYCFGGAFLEFMARVAGILSGARQEVADALARFGKHHGTALQIVNDIGDLVPSSADPDAHHAEYQDQFGDLRAGKLTMPLYLGLQDVRCAEQIQQLRASRACDPDGQIQVASTLWGLGAIHATRRLAREEDARAKSSLCVVPRSSARDMLSIMAATAKTNKYYVTLRDLFSSVTKARR